MPDVLEITVFHEAGLHARPLAQFVKTVKQYDAQVTVWNKTLNKGPARGESPVKLMLLTVQRGHAIRIEAEGAQSADVLAALRDLIQRDFAE